MSEPAAVPIGDLLGREKFDRDTIEALGRRALTAVKDRDAITQFAASLAKATGADRQKRGIALAALGRYEEAVEALVGAKPADPAGVVLGRCYRALGRTDEAVKVLKKVSPDGWTELDIELELAATALAAGDVEESMQILNRNTRRGQDSPVFHLRRGMALEQTGDVDGAIEAYQTALEQDDQPEAAFRLGRLADLHGADELAFDAYKRCLDGAALYVNALVNLGLLHEDREEYEEAAERYSTALRLEPTNPRAALFLKDAHASTMMYIDEDLERRTDRRNQILETPVTDFELSVRSRNCLKKMGVKTLGDLARCTEPELLSYKNFGETSLKEIKVILASKNLRLGMGRDAEPIRGRPAHAAEDQADSEVLAKLIDELELSVRGRRALERLDIHSVGDLIQCTEAELLACKNFGQTSLNEVKSRLTDLGLSLKEA